MPRGSMAWITTERRLAGAVGCSAAGGVAELLDGVRHHFIGGYPENQANVLGKQDDGLAAWKTTHGIHHETNGPQGSHRKGLFAEMVDRTAAAHARSQWREAAQIG